MGFVPFAEPVGPADARYQPMYLTLATARDLLARLGSPCPDMPAAISFMPGPVEIAPAVQRAVGLPPISHRIAPFLELVADVKQRLLALTGAYSVELLLGSGTLGNDVVAAQLGLLPGRGLVLSNGEFGNRLVDHASRMGLSFDVQSFGWGEVCDLQAVASFLTAHPETTWLWTVHCETSTGILNEVADLEALCSRHSVRLCLDCTSSLGTIPVDLRGVYLASSVSGKGLAAFPGISLIFCNHTVDADGRLPRYLDLGYYREHGGIPFTHSSNLVAALRQALVDLQPEERFRAINRQSSRLRRQLAATGFDLLVADRHSSPAIITVTLPPQISSRQLGESMEKRGWLLSYMSSYLLERNLIQICLMGTVSEEQSLQMIEAFVEERRRYVA
jgi:aspartate aminotransferase-like enzyme